MRELKPIVARIAAPRVFVFQCLTAYGEPSPVWEHGLEPEVMQRDGRVLVVRFRSRLVRRVAVTVDRVRLFPPERIHFERIEGRPADIRAEITLVPVTGGTELRLEGDVTSRTPVLGAVVEATFTAPRVARAMRRAVERYRVTIEAASRASGRADEVTARPT